MLFREREKIKVHFSFIHKNLLCKPCIKPKHTLSNTSETICLIDKSHKVKTFIAGLTDKAYASPRLKCIFERSQLEISCSDIS